MDILLLDDESHILKDLGSELEYKDFKVHRASNFDNAINIIKKQEIDYAIIDLMISSKNTSYGSIEVLHFCNKQKKSINKIIISGTRFEYVEEEIKKDILLLNYTEKEIQQIISDISCNYIYKGGKQNYIDAVLEKIGITDDTSCWYGSYHSLFFAVQDYKDKNIQNLKYPIADAIKLKNVLLEYYVFDENKFTLIKNPTRSEIIKELFKISHKLTSLDNLLIFYAGHGIIDENRDQGYWLPSDANKTNPSHWLSNSDIRDFLRAIKTKHTLLISDTCFGGSILKEERRNFQRGNVQEKYNIPSRSAITSTDPNHEVTDKSKFLNYLIMNLAVNKKKFIDAEKLYANISETFQSDLTTNQNPVYGKIRGVGDNIGGDFIFIRQ